MNKTIQLENDLTLSRRTLLLRALLEKIGTGLLFSIAGAAGFIVLFIIGYIGYNALPFFQLEGFTEFFTSSRWYPSQEPAEFGALAIFTGSAMVTVGAVLIAAPLGIVSAVCLSDIMSFKLRQWVKPVVEILAAIPSVAYGFFALVVLAPILQSDGGTLLAWIWRILSIPMVLLLSVILTNVFLSRFTSADKAKGLSISVMIVLALIGILFSQYVANYLEAIQISSGTNALNVTLVLSIMALPTIVSISEDSLQSVGRDMREGSYALGATRAETLLKVIIPSASSGILAAVLLGVMRALGETIIVWMASGNAAKVPDPIWNYLEPIRTLTATIAGDMGEADHVTGSSRYHVLFAMGFSLLIFSFVLNLISEKIVARQRAKLRGE